MKKRNLCVLIATIEEMDLTIVEFSEVLSEAVEECYGSHNYEEFKKVINEKLK